MKDKSWIIVACVGLLAIGLAWLFYSTKDAQVAKIDEPLIEMVEQATNPGPDDAGQKPRDETKASSDEETDEGQKFFSEMERLSGEGGENPLVQMVQKNMDDFFAKSKDEQNAELDMMLKLMEQIDGDGPPGGGPPQGGPSPNFGMMIMAAIATGGPLGSEEGPFGGDRFKFLDGTNSQMRAQAGELQKMMRERMRQRGQ